MSLSVGTRNLKFMQRAAAAKAQAEGKVAEAVPELPKGVDQAEEDAKWVLPRRAAAAAAAAGSVAAGNAEAGPSRPKVSFVASYLPFVAEETFNPGRRAFGGFTAKDDDDGADDGEEDGDGAGTSDGGEEEDDGDQPMTARKGKSASAVKPTGTPIGSDNSKAKVSARPLAPS